MKLNAKLSWIGMQLKQRDNGDLPVWDDKRQQWYVGSADRYYAEFNLAVDAAMGARVRYRAIGGNRL